TRYGTTVQRWPVLELIWLIRLFWIHWISMPAGYWVMIACGVFTNGASQKDSSRDCMPGTAISSLTTLFIPASRWMWSMATGFIQPTGTTAWRLVGHHCVIKDSKVSLSPVFTLHEVQSTISSSSCSGTTSVENIPINVIYSFCY